MKRLPFSCFMSSSSSFKILFSPFSFFLFLGKGNEDEKLKHACQRREEGLKSCGWLLEKAWKFFTPARERERERLRQRAKKWRTEKAQCQVVGPSKLLQRIFTATFLLVFSFIYFFFFYHGEVRNFSLFLY
ncbi:hypothetical protein Dimus_002450 [Dionaea muscipula]